MVEDVLGCKWTVELLGKITTGCHRPGRLRRAVPGLSAKVMNQRLTRLIGFGVLERRALSEKPLHVEYHLTAKGRELATLVGEIRRFARRWDAPTPVHAARRAGAVGRAARSVRVGRPPRPARARAAAS
jgi:DNA-binding HxlR family transcriptional regulator